jgi:hypothetical protein
LGEVIVDGLEGSTDNLIRLLERFPPHHYNAHLGEFHFPLLVYLERLVKSGLPWLHYRQSIPGSQQGGRQQRTGKQQENKTNQSFDSAPIHKHPFACYVCLH